MIDLALLHQLLDVDAELGPYPLVQAAFRVSTKLPALPISAAVAEGHTSGSGATDYLRRVQARAADYARLHDEVVAVAEVRCLKGAELADRYPQGIVRPVGDLDLIALSERDMWRAARHIVAARPIPQVDLALFGTPSQVMLHASWPADDPLLDPPMGVDLCTVAYSERARKLPVRAGLPTDPWTANFLAVAEERFQRAFDVKDTLDVLVLRDTAVDPAEVAKEADQWRLAPEAAELLEHAARGIALGPLEALLTELRRYRPAELRRRQEPATLAPESTLDVTERLRTGTPVYGMLLGDTPLGDAVDRMDFLEFDGGLIARTPLGDYLLVASALVDPDLYEAALAALSGQQDLTCG